MSKGQNRVSPAGDPRKFAFNLQCRHCLTTYQTLQTGKTHFVYEYPALPSAKIKCECCGTTFRQFGRCVAHLNIREAHLRKRSRVVVISRTSSSDTEPVRIKAETPTESFSSAGRNFFHPTS